MPAPPLIGITAGVNPLDPECFQLRWDYVQAVAEAGGIPVVLARGKAARHPAYLDGFRAIVLSGGGDIDPGRYGAKPHVSVRDVHAERDEFELDIATRALERDLPVLGICRGMQLLNVLHGGTLIQDLPDGIGEEIRHDDPRRRRDVLVHKVRFDPSSRLCRIFGRDDLLVNSFHHQAVDRLGDGLSAVAWSDEKVVEGLEGSGNSFLVGVQWHPESLWRRGPPYLALFEALCRAARERPRVAEQPSHS